MSKVKLGSKSSIYPYPVTLLGSVVDGRINFMNLGFVGICNASPGMIAMGLGRNHFTTKGILTNRTFSLNIPSKDMIIEADYVGIATGEKVDKSDIFSIFYGETTNAPLIENCPINIECKVLDVLDHGGHDYIIISEIIEVHCSELCMTDGKPDIEKMQPMLMSMYDNRYWAIGDYLGKAWGIGREYKK